MVSVELVLREITKSYTDKRFYYCDLLVEEEDNGRILLVGTVLDADMLTAVTNHLSQELPNHTINNDKATILRQEVPTIYTVSTTITGLHDAQGFLSETASQLLNGASVELLYETGKWAFVRQMDGYLGWMYCPYLSAGSTPAADYIICEPVGLLRHTPDVSASIVSRVLGGTAVTIQEQKEGCVHIELIGGLTGWLPQDNLRKQTNQPQTEAALRAQLVADAQRFTGVPYLWGGSSAYGIDCSGMVQLVHRLSGIILPRDADLQYENGRIVEPPYQPGDLFFFGESGGHRRISHVGMSLGGWEMIHASRSKNGVYQDNVQAVEHLRNSFLGARTFL